MEITNKILKKLLAKKYRQEFSLCILEGEKIIEDHMDLVVKIFPEDTLKNLENYHGRVAVARIPQPTTPTTPFLTAYGTRQTDCAKTDHPPNRIRFRRDESSGPGKPSAAPAAEAESDLAVRRLLRS